LPSGSVSCRRELVEALDGAVGKFGQDRDQVWADRKTEFATAFDDGEDRRYYGPGFLASKGYPVLPSQVVR